MTDFGLTNMNNLPTSIALEVSSVDEATRWFQARFPTSSIANHGELAVVQLGDTRIVLLHGPRGRTRQILVEVNPEDCLLESADDVEIEGPAKPRLGSRWATLSMPDRMTRLVLVTPVPPLSAAQLELVRRVLKPLKKKVAAWNTIVQADSKVLRDELDDQIASARETLAKATGRDKEKQGKRLSTLEKKRTKPPFDLKSVWNKELDRLLEEEGPHRIKWILAGINPGGKEARDGRYLHPEGPSGAPMRALLRHDVPSWDFALVLNQTSLSSSNVDELKSLSPTQKTIFEESLLAMAKAISQLAKITRAHVWVLGNKELFDKKSSAKPFHPFFAQLARFYSKNPELRDRLYLSKHPSRGSLFTELPMTDELLAQGLEAALRPRS
ncbi:hypothetical protein ACN47A_41050 [Myxococcus fulvus]|uniref:hypothetical protein n=1 Tax=Myxococcus fulvus TaxID=33 RepID=UPI003B991FFB